MKNKLPQRVGALAVVTAGLVAPLSGLAQDYLINFKTSLGDGVFTFNKAELPYFSPPPGYPNEPLGLYGGPSSTTTFNGSFIDSTVIFTIDTNSISTVLRIWDEGDPQGIEIDGTGPASLTSDGSIDNLLGVLGSSQMNYTFMWLSDTYQVPVTEFSLTEVPEPSSVELLGAGGVALGLLFGRRHRRGVSLRPSLQ